MAELQSQHEQEINALTWQMETELESIKKEYDTLLEEARNSAKDSQVTHEEQMILQS